ncbi:MAG: site-2 protease family protein [Candidatus Gastranaerophilaceae bacterium]|nr:site-2 protease family protein [Christensenellales bacterium]
MFDFILDRLQGFLYMLPAFVIALSVHEWAHAYTAYRAGDMTAYSMGRMTLNPLKHIDPIGLLMVALVGFGWARAVPVNPRNFRNPKKDNIMVSLAGIIANISLALLSVLVVDAVFKISGLSDLHLKAAWSYIFVFDNKIANILMYFMSSFVIINITLAVFNLLPIPPLDGSHLLEGFILRNFGPSALMTLNRYGMMILIIVLLILSYTGIFSILVDGIFNAITSVFAAFYGLF